MGTLLQDVRYGLRMLVKNPGFTAVAVLTLALGIGANTAIFSVIEAVLLRPLPYKDPARLFLLADPENLENGGFFYKDFEAYRSQSRAFEDVAIYYRNTGFSRVTLTAGNEPEAVQGAFVSANFFPLMGVPPSLGRAFTPEEERRRERVVILSHGLWLRRFGGSLDVIGNELQIDGINSKIIGVMPATFEFPARNQQFWAPITANGSWDDPELTKINPIHTRYFYARWQAIGRLKPGVNLQRAQAEIDTIFRRIDQTDPDKNRGSIKIVALRVNLSGNTRLALFVLFTAVSFVLLIACSNVANLILARGAARDREMAIRAALGAGRGRLARQLFTESLLFALISGCLGLVLAASGVRVLLALGPPDIPRLEQASLDARVLAFMLGISLFAAMIFGLAPAWKISRSDPNESLKSGARTASGSIFLKHTRNVLVVVEFALAIVLLTGTGLLVRSFLAVEAVDPGFQPEHVLTMRINLPAGTPNERRTDLYDLAQQQVRALPGVQAVGAIDGLFELGRTTNLGLRSIEGHTPEPPERWTALTWKVIRGDYFQAMRTPLLKGRSFSEQDGPASPLVAIIDESMARRYWPREDPIGKRFKGGDPRGRNDEWLTVIGVVRDMRSHGLERQPTPHVFEWYRQTSYGTSDFVIRTTDNPQTLAVAVRRLVRGLDQTAILSSLTTVEEQLSEQLSPRRFQTWLLGLFSVIALVLASVGIFGVIHYSVAQRTHEIGIRMALGARKEDVMTLVVGQGGRLALQGVAIGVLAALALTRLMESLLFGVSATDPVAFFGAAILLILVALFACWIPARRATRVDPVVALRYE